MCDWGGGPNEIYNYLPERLMDKNAKPPIKWDDIKRDKGAPPKEPFVKGTIDPPIKK